MNKDKLLDRMTGWTKCDRIYLYPRAARENLDGNGTPPNGSLCFGEISNKDSLKWGLLQHKQALRVNIQRRSTADGRWLVKGADVRLHYVIR